MHLSCLGEITPAFDVKMRGVPWTLLQLDCGGCSCRLLSNFGLLN